MRANELMRFILLSVIFLVCFQLIGCTIVHRYYDYEIIIHKESNYLIVARLIGEYIYPEGECIFGSPYKLRIRFELPKNKFNDYTIIKIYKIKLFDKNSGNIYFENNEIINLIPKVSEELSYNHIIPGLDLPYLDYSILIDYQIIYKDEIIGGQEEFQFRKKYKTFKTNFIQRYLSNTILATTPTTIRTD